MHGLPADFDTTLFVGRVVGAICATENTISIQFDPNAQITVEGGFRHTSSIGLQSSERAPRGLSLLIPLVGRTVAGGSAEGGRHLVLEFDDGQLLACLDDSDAYESYTIAIDGLEFFV